jgi:phosphonate transport system substrate-binding protein
MMLPRAGACIGLRLLARAVLVGLPSLSSPATAQSVDELLDMVKPWIKQQIFGERAPQPAPEDSAPETRSSDDALPGGPAEDAGDAAAGGSRDEGVLDEGRAAVDMPSETGTASLPDISVPLEGAPDALSAPPVDIAPAPVDPGPPTLRFAVLAGRSAAETIGTVGPLADELGTILGRPVEILPMSSYAAMIDAQIERRIDGGFYSASAFALADTRCQCLEPIVAPRAFDETLAYHAVIVARAGSEIRSVSDLEGRKVAVGAADSVGARRMQLAGLMSSGLDPATFLGGVIEVTSANDAVRLLRDRQADAAFAWSSLSGDVAGGYSRGTLAQLVAGGEIAMSDFTIVWRSPPIMHGPFAVLRSMDVKEKDRIASFLLTLEATHPAAYDLLNPFYGGGYAPVDAADYGAMEELAAQDVDALRLPVSEALPVVRTE